MSLERFGKQKRTNRFSGKRERMILKEIEFPWDKVLQEDLENIALSDLSFNEFRDSTILVTGATGLIGSYMIKALLTINRINHTNIRLIAQIRSHDKAKEVFGHLYGHKDISFLIGDIAGALHIDEKIDYIIHTASITSSKMFVTKPVDTFDSIILGTKNVLELGKINQVKGFVYLSSMEVYGITDPKKESISEMDLGYIDNLKIRSVYSEGKRMAETMCAAYSSQFNMKIKIARLAQTFGAGVSMTENRVFAQFAKSAMNGTDIVLHTKGESVGNYCYTRDAAKAILMLLVKGEDGEAYNISNEDSTISIKGMANLVAQEISGGNINVVFDIPDADINMGYAPDVRMKLDSSKMKGLGWKAEINLEDSYRRMMQSMINSSQQSK